MNLIVAMDKNQLIGNKNELPWDLPNDLKYFKKITLGNIVVMGRNTFDSIGKPLPKRENVVLTTNKNWNQNGIIVLHSVEDLIKAYQNCLEKVFVIGGSIIYKELLPYVNKLWITEIDHSFNGDTYFPTFCKDEWTLISSEIGKKDEHNNFNYQFKVFERIK